MSVTIRAVWALTCERSGCQWVMYLADDADMARAMADLHEQTHAKEATP